jgi:putative methionine-R-sulfoxide reductase with GAF domain
MTTFGSAQPETPFPPRKEVAAATDPAADNPHANGSFEGQELDAALQLLVERAQFITGATGGALALLQGEEMICRASTGPSGPAVGARLQVRSGLSGESIARKQLLRCDNAETDPRVNRETCRDLGIASIVVLPLLSRSGKVRGVFELFSDHAYAFEERDLIALERMADLTLTALDLAERRPRVVVTPPSASGDDPTLPSAGSGQGLSDTVDIPAPSPEQAGIPPEARPALIPDPAPEPPPSAVALPVPAPDQPVGAALAHAALVRDTVPEPLPAAVPEAMRRVQKCATCGFPVSEGRKLCVDCENKRHFQPQSADTVPSQSVPAFLDSAAPPKESWLSDHVNVLAVLVLILSIVVAVVVFR